MCELDQRACCSSGSGQLAGCSEAVKMTYNRLNLAVCYFVPIALALMTLGVSVAIGWRSSFRGFLLSVEADDSNALWPL